MQDWIARMREQVVAGAKPGHDNYSAIAVAVRAGPAGA